MQENNFEREVRLKTGELKIKPSEEVWQKVAVAIEKRKTGRRLVAFILLLLLLAGSGLVLFIQTKPNDNKNIAVQSLDTSTSKNENKQPGNSIHDITASNKKEKASESISTDSNLNASPKPVVTARKTSRSKMVANIAIGGPTVGEDQGNTVVDQYKKGSRKNINYTSRKKLNSQVSQAETGEDINTEPVTEEVFAARVMLADNQPIQLLSIDAPKGKTTITGNVVDQFSLLLHPVDEIAKLNPVKNDASAKQSSVWKLGFLLSGGVSATRSGYLGVIGVSGGSENKAFDPLQSNVGSGTTAPPPSGGTYSPSQISSGYGLLAGVFARRNISSKAMLSVGLNYKQYSSSMSVGNRVDTGSFYNQFGNFFRIGTRSNYHNHFHFIELPVALQYRLGKSPQSPVYLKAGLSISQLVSSNALQFDPQSGNYYANNGLLNKTQLSITTGLLFSLSRRSPNALALGPDLHFNLTKMAGSGLYSGRRYSYFGLLLQKTIGKK